MIHFTMTGQYAGYRGVAFNKRLNKWQAYVTSNGKRVHLGLFPTPEDADRAVREARGELLPYSYEPNGG